MFQRLVLASLSNRPAVLAATLVVLVWGLFSFRNLTIEAFPDPTDTQVNVISIYPGQPAEELERQVSIPIERVVNGMPGLARVRSINLFGLSFITLTFRDGIDALTARAQTLERVRLAELPASVVPQLGSLSTPIGEIYRYSLASDAPPAEGTADGGIKGPDGGAPEAGETTPVRGDPMRLRTLQDWVVRPRLLQVDGVADVVSYGGLVREIQVRPDPVQLAAKGLTLRELEDAIEGASQNASGGVLERGAEQLVIRSQGLFAGVRDIERVGVATRNGTPIFVGDIASVQEGWAPRQGIYGRGEDHDAVEGIVLMRRGENPTDVLERVRARVEELNTRILPRDVRLWPFYDRTELVQTTLKTVGHNLLEGALLVLFVLVAVLLDVREGKLSLLKSLEKPQVEPVIPLGATCERDGVKCVAEPMHRHPAVLGKLGICRRERRDVSGKIAAGDLFKRLADLLDDLALLNLFCLENGAHRNAHVEQCSLDEDGDRFCKTPGAG